MTTTKALGRPLGSKNKREFIKVNLSIPNFLVNKGDAPSTEQLAKTAGRLSAAITAISAFCAEMESIAFADIPDVRKMQNDLQEQLLDLRGEIEQRKQLATPYARSMVQRTAVEIPDAIKQLSYRVREGEKVVARKRKGLLDAGIENEEAVRLFPNFDATELTSEIAALEAEAAQWKQFQDFGRVEYLPANAEECRARIGGYRQAK